MKLLGELEALRGLLWLRRRGLVSDQLADRRARQNVDEFPLDAGKRIPDRAQLELLTVFTSLAQRDRQGALQCFHNINDRART